MGWKSIEERRRYARDYYRKNREELLTAGRPLQRARLAKQRKSDPALFLFRAARKRAKESNLAFNLDPEDVRIPLVCPFLGLVLIPNFGAKKHAPNSPTLDRIEPRKGYVKGNVRVISFLANAMKRDATPEQLRIFAISVLLEQKYLELEY